MSFIKKQIKWDIKWDNYDLQEIHRYNDKKVAEEAAHKLMLSWDETDKEEAMKELYRFFLLYKYADSDKLSPGKIIDELWHSLMLRPKLYVYKCTQLVGKLIDHNPDGWRDEKKRKERYDFTLEMYEKIFKQKPPVKFWPNHNNEVTNHNNEVTKEITKEVTKELSLFVESTVSVLFEPLRYRKKIMIKENDSVTFSVFKGRLYKTLNVGSKYFDIVHNDKKLGVNFDDNSREFVDDLFVFSKTLKELGFKNNDTIIIEPRGNYGC